MLLRKVGVFVLKLFIRRSFLHQYACFLLLIHTRFILLFSIALQPISSDSSVGTLFVRIDHLCMAFDKCALFKHFSLLLFLLLTEQIFLKIEKNVFFFQLQNINVGLQQNTLLCQQLIFLEQLIRDIVRRQFIKLIVFGHAIGISICYFNMIDYIYKFRHAQLKVDNKAINHATSSTIQNGSMISMKNKQIEMEYSNFSFLCLYQSNCVIYTGISLQQSSQNIMESNTHIDKNSRNSSLRKSVIVTASQLRENQQITLQNASKNLESASTFIRIGKDKALPIKFGQHQNDLNNHSKETKRPLSINSGAINKNKLNEGAMKIGEPFNDHLIKLKVEEMAFKIKTKIGTLLKEMNIPLTELTKYASLTKIDDFLNFVSQKVRQRLVRNENNQNNITKVRTKQRQILSEYQLQIQTLKTRLGQKQIAEKTQKIKLKQNYNQIRQLYDRINLKEKQLSTKITESYQNKIFIKENQKFIESLQIKCQNYEREIADMRDIIEKKTINNSSNYQQVQDENANLHQLVAELKEDLQMAEEKQKQLIQFNKSISEEVARWRERFEESREQRINEKQPVSTSNDFSLSPASSKDSKNIAKGFDQNYLYKFRVKQQQNQIGELKKTIIQLLSYKQKFNSISQTAQDMKKQLEERETRDKLDRQKVKSNVQLEEYYKKKMEQMSAQWRDKLTEIINSSAEFQQSQKHQKQRLRQQKQDLQKKLFNLANQKYILQCKIIEKQNQIAPSKAVKPKKNSNFPNILQENLLQNDSKDIQPNKISPLKEHKEQFLTLGQNIPLVHSETASNDDIELSKS